MKSSQEYKKLSQQDCIEEIIKLKRELFNLRLKKATKQSFKSHIFKTNKRRLAQLLTQSNIIGTK